MTNLFTEGIFQRIEFLNLNKSAYQCSFMFHVFCVLPKISLFNPRSPKSSLKFSSKYFKALTLVFNSMSQLIFMAGVNTLATSCEESTLAIP